MDLNWFINNWSTVLNFIAYAISLASIIVKFTPDPKDDTALADIIKLLKLLALYKDKDI